MKYALEIPVLNSFDEFETFFSPSDEISDKNFQLALICIATAYPLLTNFTANTCSKMQVWAEILMQKELNRPNRNFLSAFDMYDKLAQEYADKNLAT